MMRKLLVIPLVSACSVGSVLSDTPLQITATTTAKGGEYQPANVVSVWIESADGTAIKTIQRWSGVRTPHLVAWRQKAGASDADAVSGATRANHTTPLTIKWSLRDRNQQIVPDGTYTIRMELADGNSTAAGDNNQGTFTFVKGMEPQNQTGLANGGFTNVSIEFAP